MTKPFIHHDNGNYYAQRSYFTYAELVARLPTEMLAAKATIPEVQCYGRFNVSEYGYLRCNVIKNGEWVGLYCWNNTGKVWRV